MDAEIVCVVAPVLHKYAFAVAAVKEIVFPLQIVVDPPAVILAVGNAFTTTEIGVEVDEQLKELLTVTEYVPDAVTVMDCVVAPFDHK